jgi:anti-sigma B factor antagonist
MDWIVYNEIQILLWSQDVTQKNVDDFRQAVWKLLGQEGTGFVLDLEPIVYLNSAALGIIADAILQGRLRHKHLVITGIQPTVEEIFNIVKFSAFMKTFKQRDDAIEYLKKFNRGEEWNDHILGEFKQV